MKEFKKKKIKKKDRFKSLPVELLERAEVQGLPIEVEPGDFIHLGITDSFGEFHEVLEHEVKEAFIITEAVVFSFKDTEDYETGYGGFFAQRKK